MDQEADPASAVRKLGKVSRRKEPIIEQKGLHVGSHRLHGAERVGIAAALIRKRTPIIGSQP